MALKFTTVSKSVHAAYVKAMVYAGAGLGKTVLCTTLGPGTLMLSAESGLLSVRRPNLERLFGVGNPTIDYDMQVLEVRNILDLVEIRQWLYASQEARRFHTVAIDSITEIGEVVLKNAKAAVKDPRQAYGHLSDTIIEEVRNFRNLPNHNVVMTAKEAQYKDEMTGGFRYGPDMPGRKLGPALPYYFDEVFRLGVARTAEGRPYRYLLTQPDSQYDAKDRSGALAVVEPPHLSTVFAKILGA